MKNGVIITNAYYSGDAPSYQARRIEEELKLLNSAVYIHKNNDYTSYVDETGKFRTPFEKADYAVFLDKDKYLSRILEGVGVRLFDTARAIELCDDKMLTHLALTGADIKMPKTVPAPLCYNASAEISPCEAKKVVDILGLPIVVKSSFGSLGKEVFLARTESEVLSLMNFLKGKPYIFQQFITSSFGRDVRIIVIGGKAFSSMMRKSSGDFRSNVGLGGCGYAYTPAPSFIDAAERAAKTLGLDYCGVDLLFGYDGEPVLCEVNSNAFFGEMEKVSGKNVAKAYAEHILNTL